MYVFDMFLFICGLCTTYVHIHICIWFLFNVSKHLSGFFSPLRKKVASSNYAPPTVFFRAHSGAICKHFSMCFTTAETPLCTYTKLYLCGYIITYSLLF